jgi:hypothetical protein
MLWRIITLLIAQYLWRVVLIAYQILNSLLTVRQANLNQRRLCEKKSTPKNRIFTQKMAVFCHWVYQRWRRVCAALVSSVFHFLVGLKMKRCKHIDRLNLCGSYAFNLLSGGIDQGDLCDVHYWQEQVENSFSPDYDTQAVLVEEMQRMAAELKAAKEWIKKSEKIIADQDAKLISQKRPTKIVGPNFVEILNAAGFYQKRPWVGLTEERIQDIWLKGKDHGDDWADVLGLARAFESELKEKNS